MTAVVPLMRPLARPRDVFTADPVRALTGLEAAKLSNWCLGRGAHLIPSYAPIVTVTATSELIFRWRTRPRFQALQRIWFFRFRAASPMGVSIEVPSGATAITGSASDTRETAHSIAVIETLGSQSATEAEITAAITPGDATSLTIESISCWEIPRATLSTANSDLGTDLARFVTGQPILANLDNAIDAIADPTLLGRRASLSQWAVPATVGGSTSTTHAKATTGVDAYETIYSGLPHLTRKDAPAATTGLLTCKMYAWVTGGSADLRLNSSVHGASSAVNITNTTPAWIANPITLSVDCEDLAEADGLQGGVFDRLTPQMRKNTSGTCYVAAVSIWEA